MLFVSRCQARGPENSNMQMLRAPCTDPAGGDAHLQQATLILQPETINTLHYKVEGPQGPLHGSCWWRYPPAPTSDHSEGTNTSGYKVEGISGCKIEGPQSPLAWILLAQIPTRNCHAQIGCHRVPNAAPLFLSMTSACKRSAHRAVRPEPNPAQQDSQAIQSHARLQQSSPLRPGRSKTRMSVAPQQDLQSVPRCGSDPAKLTSAPRPRRQPLGCYPAAGPSVCFKLGLRSSKAHLCAQAEAEAI